MTLNDLINAGFARRLIRPDTWIVNELLIAACSTHVLIGKEKALVIDPGENERSIRNYIEESITSLPLMVANTHGHFDHTGSNGQFRDCPIYMSEFAATECKNIHAGKDPALFPTDYEPITIRDGHVFDLGDREVEAIAIGCHSPGSLAYLDRKYRILFAGDEIDSGQVLIHDMKGTGFPNVERYYNNLLKLKARAGEFDMICSAHNGSPMDASILDAFIENCERILSGIEGKRELSSISFLTEFPGDPRGAQVKKMREDPRYRRSEWKGSSIVYNIHQIRMPDRGK